MHVSTLNRNGFLSQNSIIEVPIDWYEPRLVNFEQLQRYTPNFCAEKRHHFASNSEALRARLSNGYFELAFDGLRQKEPGLAEIAKTVTWETMKMYNSLFLRIKIFKNVSQITNL